MENDKLELITKLSFEIGYSKEYIKKFFSQRNNKLYNEFKFISFLGISKKQLLPICKNIVMNKNFKNQSIVQIKKHIATIRNNIILLNELKNEFR